MELFRRIRTPDFDKRARRWLSTYVHQEQLDKMLVRNVGSMERSAILSEVVGFVVSILVCDLVSGRPDPQLPMRALLARPGDGSVNRMRAELLSPDARRKLKLSLLDR
jgi:hypothetical protein